MKPLCLIVPLVIALLTPSIANADAKKLVALRGEVIDADTQRPLPSRVYIQSADGTWHFPRSEAKDGSAVSYRKQRKGTPPSVEMHTTLSAHPFVIDLPPGQYTITVEHGKEYHPLTKEVSIGLDAVGLKLPLKRWINMAEHGWYSGETHVHRTLEELPNVMLAEDLNVAFPITSWVTEAFTAPKGEAGERAAKPIAVDATHIIFPRNTEYEIFTVNKKPHTLGAFFALNHQSMFTKGVPPVRSVAEQAHKEGGLIEMDKHNWPWSMALVPLIKPDLYELANNHVWRTDFGFPSFGEPAAEYMRVERDRHGFTERGWLDYGFQNYYALLNCGFRIRPTAGTASGVHPVPLGFGRVYVECPLRFSYREWLDGLIRGRIFVTTGPMLFVDDALVTRNFRDYTVTGSAVSEYPLDRIEIIVNGEVARVAKPENKKTAQHAYESKFSEKVTPDGTSWVAVRCFEDRPDKRVRFAHSSPMGTPTVAEKPLAPPGVRRSTS